MIAPHDLSSDKVEKELMEKKQKTQTKEKNGKEFSGVEGKIFCFNLKKLGSSGREEREWYKQWVPLNTSYFWLV